MSARDHLLFDGDALDACARLPGDLEFDLVYLDPPYAAGGARTARKAEGGARAKLSRSAAGAAGAAYVDYDTPEELLAMLTPRLDAIRARMSQCATFWLHLDHRAVHDAKVACDRVFGRGAFLGEVIWIPGNGARGKRLAVTHQTLLLYATSARDAKHAVWNGDDEDLREPFAATSLAMHFKNTDGDGRAFRERVIAGKSYRYYADEGRQRGSVWADIPAMLANTPLRAEATGYPTQKPERLLERIVRATSAPGATVADLMCGSGTTMIAAARLGRRAVGGDASAVAIATARARLDAAGVPFTSLK